MQIQKLEDELNISIFDRTKKPIELTKVGSTIIKQARETILEFNKIKEVINDKKETLKGEFIFKGFKN